MPNSHQVFYAFMVAFGGAIGSVLRYSTGIVMGHFFGSAFPYGTLTVNIIGSLVMGIMAGLGAFVWQWPEPFRVFFMVGLLGGFTTFSSFSLDVLTLVDRGEPVLAMDYVFISVVASLFAVFAGLSLIKTFA